MEMNCTRYLFLNIFLYSLFHLMGIILYAICYCLLLQINRIQSEYLLTWISLECVLIKSSKSRIIHIAFTIPDPSFWWNSLFDIESYVCVLYEFISSEGLRGLCNNGIWVSLIVSSYINNTKIFWEISCI